MKLETVGQRVVTAYGAIVKLPDGDYYTTYYWTVDEAVHVFGQRFRVVRMREER